MRRRILRFLPLLALGATMAWANAPANPRTAAPRRIVSLNLCSDQLVVALADRTQIAGVTVNAAQPDMSAEAARARGLPVVRHSAEQLLAIRPDLIVGTPARGMPGVAMLARRGTRTLDLPWANRLEDIFASIRSTAAAVGHPARGTAMITAMRRDLHRLPQVGGGKVAAYYQRRGYMTGAGTLVDDLMTRVGLVNLATRLGKPALSQISLEEMVVAHPDLLIVESAPGGSRDQGTEMLRHPALRSIPRVIIPEAWTVCGGPAYVRAARAIAAQVERAGFQGYQQ